MTRTKLVVLASGQGRILEALIETYKGNLIAPQIAGLIASRAGIGALKLAEAHQIPCAIVDIREYPSREDWDRDLCCQLQAWQTEWILLSGYLVRLGPIVLGQYDQKVVNSHPSLLPAYGGKGMYGRRVHEAVLANKEKNTGVTIHLVDSNYDEGPIVAQRTLAIFPEDNPESLEKRVIELEKAFVAETIFELCRSMG